MAFTATSRMRQLARLKLDQVGDWWRELLPRAPASPRTGWIASTRDALAMSRSELARRLGVSTTSVAKLETSELAGTIQLNTLRRAAEALDCQVVVAVVPRQSLQSMVDQQRVKQYDVTLARMAMHMDLENQPMSKELREHLLKQAEGVIPDSVLWRESGHR